jgi:hypothetical protein
VVDNMFTVFWFNKQNEFESFAMPIIFSLFKHFRTCRTIVPTHLYDSVLGSGIDLAHCLDPDHVRQNWSEKDKIKKFSF